MNIGFLYAIGAAVTWGLVYTIDQKILSITSPITLLFVDSIITALIMLPFVLFDHGEVSNLLSSGKMNVSLVLLSLILAAVANFLIFSGIKLIGATDASIIEIAYPFFVVFFTYLAFHSKPNLYFFLGAILIFVGSAVIIKFS